MESPLDFTEPVPLVRPRSAHRFETFSPKINRRLTFYRRCALDQWILIESDPEIRTFCERPGFVQFRDQPCLADFWVSYADRQELVILPTPLVDVDAEPAALEDGIAIRVVQTAQLTASRVWIDNWRRMLPSIVTTRRLLQQSLLHAIHQFTATPRQLQSIEQEFSGVDQALVRASVFWLLHAGLVRAPQLRTDTLSSSTLFEAMEG